MILVGEFDGTRQDRKSLTVRAQRDRGVSVKAGIVCPVATSRITPIGLGIAPGGDETAALYSISPAGAGGRTLQGFGRQFSYVQRPDNSSITDHEVCFRSKIVSKGRPQRCARRNRIARANKLGAALSYARDRTCDAASSATKTRNRLAECRALISEILTRLGACTTTLSAGVKEARQFRRILIGPSACLSRIPSVCRGRGLKIGFAISRSYGKVAEAHNTKNKGVSWS